MCVVFSYLQSLVTMDFFILRIKPILVVIFCLVKHVISNNQLFITRKITKIILFRIFRTISLKVDGFYSYKNENNQRSQEINKILILFPFYGKINYLSVVSLENTLIQCVRYWNNSWLTGCWTTNNTCTIIIIRQ